MGSQPMVLCRLKCYGDLTTPSLTLPREAFCSLPVAKTGDSWLGSSIHPLAQCFALSFLPMACAKGRISDPSPLFALLTGPLLYDGRGRAGWARHPLHNEITMG